MSSSIISEFLSELEELLLVKLSISLSVFYRNFTSQSSFEEISAKFWHGNFQKFLHSEETREKINSGCFAAMASPLLCAAHTPRSSPGSTVFGRIPVPQWVGVSVHTHHALVCSLLYLLLIVLQNPFCHVFLEVGFLTFSLTSVTVLPTLLT